MKFSFFKPKIDEKLTTKIPELPLEVKLEQDLGMLKNATDLESLKTENQNLDQHLEEFKKYVETHLKNSTSSHIETLQKIKHFSKELSQFFEKQLNNNLIVKDQNFVTFHKVIQLQSLFAETSQDFKAIKVVSKKIFDKIYTAPTLMISTWGIGIQGKSPLAEQFNLLIKNASEKEQLLEVSPFFEQGIANLTAATKKIKDQADELSIGDVLNFDLEALREFISSIHEYEKIIDKTRFEFLYPEVQRYFLNLIHISLKKPLEQLGSFIESYHDSIVHEMSFLTKEILATNSVNPPNTFAQFIESSLNAARLNILCQNYNQLNELLSNLEIDLSTYQKKTPSHLHAAFNATKSLVNLPSTFLYSIYGLLKYVKNKAFSSTSVDQLIDSIQADFSKHNAQIKVQQLKLNTSQKIVKEAKDIIQQVQNHVLKAPDFFTNTNLNQLAKSLCSFSNSEKLDSQNEFSCTLNPFLTPLKAGSLSQNEVNLLLKEFLDFLQILQQSTFFSKRFTEDQIQAIIQWVKQIDLNFQPPSHLIHAILSSLQSFPLPLACDHTFIAHPVDKRSLSQQSVYRNKMGQTSWQEIGYKYAKTGLFLSGALIALYQLSKQYVFTQTPTNQTIEKVDSNSLFSTSTLSDQDRALLDLEKLRLRSGLEHQQDKWNSTNFEKLFSHYPKIQEFLKTFDINQLNHFSIDELIKKFETWRVFIFLKANLSLNWSTINLRELTNLSIDEAAQKIVELLDNSWQFSFSSALSNLFTKFVVGSIDFLKSTRGIVSDLTNPKEKQMLKQQTNQQLFFHRLNNTQVDQLNHHLTSLNSLYSSYIIDNEKAKTHLEAIANLYDSSNQLPAPGVHYLEKLSRLKLDHIDLEKAKNLFFSIARLQASSSVTFSEHSYFMEQFLVQQNKLGQTKYHIDPWLNTLKRSKNFEQEFYDASIEVCSSLEKLSQTEKEQPCFGKKDFETQTKLTQILKNHAEALAVGEPLILFQKSDLKNHFSLVVYKQLNDQYKLFLVSTNFQSDKQLHIHHDGQQYFLPLSIKENIPIESLTEQSFVTLLHEMKKLPTNRLIPPWNYEHLYTQFSQFKGNEIVDEQYNDLWIKTDSINGNAFNAFSYLQRILLGDSASKRLEIELALPLLNHLNKHKVDSSQYSAALKQMAARFYLAIQKDEKLFEKDEALYIANQFLAAMPKLPDSGLNSATSSSQLGNILSKLSSALNDKNPDTFTSFGTSNPKLTYQSKPLPTLSSTLPPILPPEVTSFYADRKDALKTYIRYGESTHITLGSTLALMIEHDTLRPSIRDQLNLLFSSLSSKVSAISKLQCQTVSQACFAIKEFIETEKKRRERIEKVILDFEAIARVLQSEIAELCNRAKITNFGRYEQATFALMDLKEEIEKERLEYLKYVDQGQLVSKVALDVTSFINKMDLQNISTDEKKELISVILDLAPYLYPFGEGYAKSSQTSTNHILALARVSKLLYTLLDKQLSLELEIPYPPTIAFMGFDHIEAPKFKITDPAIAKEFAEIKAFLKEIYFNLPQAFTRKEKHDISYHNAYRLYEDEVSLSDYIKEKDGFEKVVDILIKNSIKKNSDESFLINHILPQLLKFREKNIGKISESGTKLDDLKSLYGVFMAGLHSNKHDYNQQAAKWIPETWFKFVSFAIKTYLFYENVESHKIDYDTKSTYRYFDPVTKRELFKAEVLYRTYMKQPYEEKLYEEKLDDCRVSFFSDYVEPEPHNLKNKVGVKSFGYELLSKVETFLTDSPFTYWSQQGDLFNSQIMEFKNPVILYVISYWEALKAIFFKERFGLTHNHVYQGAFSEAVLKKQAPDSLLPLVGIDIKAPANVHYDETQELLSVILTPKLRISRAISYFSRSKNFEKLFDPEYQQFLELAIFSSNDLHSELDFELAKQLANFIKNLYDTAIQFTKLSKLDAEKMAQAQFLISFLLKLNAKLESFVDLTSLDKNEVGFIDSLERVNFLLEAWNENENVLALLHMTRAAILAKDSSVLKKNIKNFYVSFMSCVNSAQFKSFKKIYPTLEAELASAANQKLNQLKELPFEEFKNWVEELLAELLITSKFPEKSIKSLYDGQVAILADDNVSMEVDFVTGDWYDSENGNSRLNITYKELYSDPTYIELFQKKRLQFKISTNRDGFFEISDNDGQVYYMRQSYKKDNQTSGLQFYKKIKGKLFLYQPQSQLAAKLPNLSFLKRGYLFWEIAEGRSGEIYALVSNDTKKGIHFSTSGVKDLSTGQVLLDVKNSPLSFLSQFEDAKFINLWSDDVVSSSLEIKKIELPRFKTVSEQGLVFEKQGQDYISNAYPGFKLNTDYKLDLMNHALVLNKNDKPTKALASLQIDAEHDGQQSALLNAAINVVKSLLQVNDPKEKPQACTLLEFEVKDSNDSLSFKPTSRKAQLYLAYLYAKNMNLQDALKLLNQLGSNISSYDPEEIRILRAILKIQSQDRNLNLLQLKASHLIVDNFTRFNPLISMEDQKGIKKLIESHYSFFLTHRDQLDYYTLEKSEELILLAYVTPTEQTESRKRQLVEHFNLSEDFVKIKQPAVLSPKIKSSTQNSVFFNAIKNLLTKISASKFSLSQLEPYTVIDNVKDYFQEFIDNASSSIEKVSLENGVDSAAGMDALKKLSEMFQSIVDSKTSFSLHAPTYQNYLTHVLNMYTYAKDYQNKKKDMELAGYFQSMSQYMHNDPFVRAVTPFVSEILRLVVDHPDYFPHLTDIENFLENQKILNSKNANSTALKPTLYQSKWEILVDIIASWFELNSNPIFLTQLQLKNEMTTVLEATDNQVKLETSELVKGLISHEKQEQKAYPQTVLSTYNDKNVTMLLTPYLETQSASSLYKNQVLAKLEPCLKPNSNEPLVVSGFETIKKDLDYYLSQPTKNTYVISDQNLKELTHKLTASMSERQKQIQEFKTKITDQLQWYPDEHAQSMHKMAIASGKQKEKSLDDALIAFLKQDLAAYHQLNSHLSDQQLNELNSNVHEYLVLATQEQHLSRILSLVKAASIAPPNEKQELIQKIAAQNLQRAYSIVDSPEYLVFEYYLSVMLYPAQVEKLKSLKSAVHSPDAIGKIVEAVMGFGKSMIMLPLLSIYIADGKTAPIIVMPESLIESLGSEVTNTLKPFEQYVKALKVDRSTQFTPEKLEELNMSLIEALENKSVLMMSAFSIQSLYLKYIETLFVASKNLTKTHESQINGFRSLFDKLSKNFKLILDEADLLLNCRHETHFTLSHFSSITPLHIDLAGFAYQLILDFAEEFNFDFLTTTANDKLSCTVENFSTHIKPKLVTSFLNKVTTEFSSLDPQAYLHVKRYFIKASPEELKKVEQYLLGQISSKEAKEYVDSIENENVANFISLAQAYFNIFLPLCLNRRLGEHYGPAVIEDEVLAIPYKLGKANEKSQFGNPYETISYSLQYYLKHGFAKQYIENELENLSKQASLEIFEKFIQFEETDAFKKLKEFYPGAKSFSLNEEEIDIAYKNIMKSNKLKLYFIKKYILSQLKLYDSRISANPQTFPQMFDKMIGFTGTLWNEKTFPRRLDTEPAVGIIGNTLTQIAKKSKDQVEIFNADLSQKQEVFSELKSLIQPQEMHAFIDLAGIFDGYSREELCREILKFKQGQGIEGVIFYNDSNQLVILTDFNTSPTLLHQSPLSNNPSKTFTFYDHQHTTGADIKQAASAQAMVSVGRHTTIRDLAQACWRMREFEAAQAVQFVALAKDAAIINSKNEDKLSLKTSEMIHYVVRLQEEYLKGRDHYLSQKQKMEAVLKNFVWKAILDPKLDKLVTINLFKDFYPLFVRQIKDEPRTQYNRVEERIDTKMALLDYLEQLSTQYKKYFTLNQWATLHHEMISCIDDSVLPTKVLYNANEKDVHSLDQDVQIETMQDQETEQETDQETERKTEQEQELERNTAVYAPNANCHVAKYTWQDTVFKNQTQSVSLASVLPGEKTFYQKTDNLVVAQFNHLIPKKYDFFSSDIYVTNNLFPALDSSKLGFSVTMPNFELYTSCQIPAQEALIVQTPQGTKFILLDTYEAEEWKIHLKGHPADANVENVFLVNLENGLVQSYPNSDQNQIEQIIDDPKFKKLLIQAKLIAAKVDMSKEQYQILEEWIQENGHNRTQLKLFLESLVFNYMPTLKENYKNMRLHQFLTEEFGDMFARKV